MKWRLLHSQATVEAIYQIPREIWREAKHLVLALQENPLPPGVQTDEDDPSKYWIALPGDYVLFYEILDEQHSIRLIEIE
jgi:mRNA-degrading endonuclease RelE of RelBE toxin-antitoxin system